MTKYTITRALTKLKNLKDEYEKKMKELKLIAVKRGDLLYDAYASYKEEDFINKVGSTNQSLMDIFNLIMEIKAKIDQSNYTTKIMICGKEMTVHEAIVLKNLLPLKKDYLNEMKKHLLAARKSYSKALEYNQEEINLMIRNRTTSAAGTTASKDILKDVEKSSAEAIDKLYHVDYVDPLKADEKIEKLEKEIREFEMDIDYVLSESNSTTYIEIGE